MLGFTLYRRHGLIDAENSGGGVSTLRICYYLICFEDAVWWASDDNLILS